MQKRADVRVLSATHRDLDAMVAAGGFREDLYYRLKGIVLRTPSLAERPADVPLLAELFLRRAPASPRLRAGRRRSPGCRAATGPATCASCAP